jgi:hypothetical protein
MPDTGPPWSIPYVEPTDNPRVYPAASEALAEAIADGLDAAGNAGIGSNVVSVTKTDLFSSTSGTYTAITGLSATITPSSATAKGLVIAVVQANMDAVANSGGVALRILRDATSSPVGDANGSAIQASAGVGVEVTKRLPETAVIVWLDSPGAATATTYQVETRRLGTAGTIRINEGGFADTTARDGVTVSTITCIEVAP